MHIARQVLAYFSVMFFFLAGLFLMSIVTHALFGYELTAVIVGASKTDAPSGYVEQVMIAGAFALLGLLCFGIGRLLTRKRH